MGQALYRKYRSKSLDEIVGQSHVTDILRRALANGHVAHAYLLTGPRGVGKTSIARILAHEINELPYADESTHLDIIEIDAASNNSVEDIRDLRDKVQIAPSLAKRKIYIIDEVHMLSKSAFNALLKTLEEPPAHVVFILATTDADKLPATIISRVQRFNFRTISLPDLQSHLRTIADAEGIAINDEALALISHHGNGSFRDSISLLDQLRSATEDTITPAHIESVLGLAEAVAVERLIDSYTTGDIATIVATLDELESRGTPASVICEQLTRMIRSRIATEPHLLPLLDRLTEVPRSPWPHIKLLTVLTSHIIVENTPVVPAPAPKQPPKPNTPRAVAPMPTPTASIVTPRPEVVTATPTPKTPAAPARPLGDPVAFKWDEFIEAVRQSATGAASVLTKCTHLFDGETLFIYAGKKFPKAQLDKSLPLLASVLQQMGYPDAVISTLPTTKPPEDSQAAAVLDIMGGGEEVSL
ncbi:MAG: DNA polymerase III subunit gamma/tau [Candidatus Saccharimonas sp.]